MKRKRSIRGVPLPVDFLLVSGKKMKLFQVTSQEDWANIPSDVTDIEILYDINSGDQMIDKYYKYIKKVQYLSEFMYMSSSDCDKFQYGTVFVRRGLPILHHTNYIHYYLELSEIQYDFSADLRCSLSLYHFLKIDPNTLEYYHYNSLDEHERYYFPKKNFLDFLNGAAPPFDILFRYSGI